MSFVRRDGMGQPPGPEEAAYALWYKRFLAAFLCLAILTVGMALFDPGTTSFQRLLCAMLISSMCLWFWLLGEWSDQDSDGRTILFIGGLIILVVLAIRVWDGSALMLFAVYWFIFGYMNLLPAITAAAILTFGMQWGFGNLPSTIISSPANLIVLVLTLTFSGMMAMYIENFNKEADRRAVLLDQLRAAQAQLAIDEREAGRRAERDRLAGEIHDTIAQQFAGIVTNLEAGMQQLDIDRTRAASHLDVALRTARQGIVDARDMLTTMQPHVVDGTTIFATIRHAVDDIVARHALTIDVQISETGDVRRLLRDQEIALLRSAQEAVTNALKHASSSSIILTLAWLDDEVILDIEDDGRGFDPARNPDGDAGQHFGLAGMERRVTGAGGTCVVESTTGEGTSVAVSFPIGRKGEHR